MRVLTYFPHESLLFNYIELQIILEGHIRAYFGIFSDNVYIYIASEILIILNYLNLLVQNSKRTGSTTVLQLTSPDCPTEYFKAVLHLYTSQVLFASLGYQYQPI